LPQKSESMLDTVSTTCDSGWVKPLGFKINGNFGSGVLVCC
jgi:hypothetical protein